jgi:histidine triad (HIT) family protein
MDCIFCKIIEGSIPAEKLYEDDIMLVIKDINPLAPFHVLAIPKGRPHLEGVSSLKEFPERASVVGHIFTVIAQKQAEWGLEGGFRVATNCGKDALQTVSHLHFHIMGGHTLSETMG